MYMHDTAHCGGQQDKATSPTSAHVRCPPIIHIYSSLNPVLPTQEDEDDMRAQLEISMRRSRATQKKGEVDPVAAAIIARREAEEKAQPSDAGTSAGMHLGMFESSVLLILASHGSAVGCAWRCCASALRAEEEIPSHKLWRSSGRASGWTHLMRLSPTAPS